MKEGSEQADPTRDFPVREFFDLSETPCPACAEERDTRWRPLRSPQLTEDVSNEEVDGSDNSGFEPNVDSPQEADDSKTTGDAHPDGDDDRLDGDEADDEEVEEDNWRPPSRGSGADDPPDFIDPSGPELV